MHKLKKSTHNMNQYNLTKSYGLSNRSQWLRDYYFLGVKREWNNEFMPFTTGLSSDRQWAETDFYIVPETYFNMSEKGMGVYGRSVNLMAQNVGLPEAFWENSLPEKRMPFFQEVMANKILQEIIGPELLAGGRFNTQLSKFLTSEEQKKFDKENLRVPVLRITSSKIPLVY